AGVDEPGIDLVKEIAKAALRFHWVVEPGDRERLPRQQVRDRDDTLPAVGVFGKQARLGRFRPRLPGSHAEQGVADVVPHGDPDRIVAHAEPSRPAWYGRSNVVSNSSTVSARPRS